jgi:hypothetical protein
MKVEDTGPLFRRIGDIIAASSQDPHRRIFYYLTVHDGVIGQTLAEDRGDHTFYRQAPDALIAAAQALWDAQDGPDKWREMSYVMEGGKFHATLYYPDDLDPKESEYDRADRIAIDVLGDKPARCDPLRKEDPGSYTFEL